MARFHPLPELPDGRRAKETSAYWARNPWRNGKKAPDGKVHPKHYGGDWFFEGKQGDPLVKYYYIARRGKLRWFYPVGLGLIATEDGKVVKAGRIQSGGRVWIDIGNGMRVGYAHMGHIAVKVGDVVHAGQVIGSVGRDTRKESNKVHLHFAVMKNGKYVDPANYLKGVTDYAPLSIVKPTPATPPSPVPAPAPAPTKPDKKGRSPWGTLLLLILALSQL